MLRRIDIKGSWRSLDAGFWPDDLPLGCQTVIYGHNGSGKSTLSELLLSLAEGDCATDVIWEHDDRHRSPVASGGVAPSLSMAVFTRKWVNENLAAFLDGEGASAIVTLGREAIDAKEEEARLRKEISDLHEVAKDAEKQRKAAASKVERLVRDVQSQIVAELKEFDYNFYTKNRFSINKVQDDLRVYKGDFPDSNAHAEALKRLGEGAPAAVPAVSAPPHDVAQSLQELEAVLADTPTRVAIDALESDSIAQTWVEDGLRLHDGLDHCLFCAGEIDASRREQLARHFDESWLRIRGNAKALAAETSQERLALAKWLASVPATASLAGELQDVYDVTLEQVKVSVDKRLVVLEEIENALSDKVADPSATPSVPDWSEMATPLTITVLAQAVGQHNEQVRSHEEVTAERKRAVLDHLIGAQSEALRELEAQANTSAERSKTSQQAAKLAERKLDEVRQARFTTKAMAEILTRDLARVYGKNHLSVAVTPDGKSYSCRRGDLPGTDLSHGERTTLSLLYFLRKLQDEQVPGGDPAQRIVVIDDPSSSLDREALFATHQWLLDTLKGFGQYIVLTHDFSLLQLFLKSKKSAWGKSRKKIRDGDSDEARFPSVAFLELYAGSVGTERKSRLGSMPKVLVNSTSEYGYLFTMVMKGVADSEDHERLFLLPNAARRILEVFASYKAPHRTDFLQQLEVLVKAQPEEPYRDVYDFCNRFSHGEGSESVDVLDARAVHGHIRRCMEFLRAVDGEHFERMCVATGIEPTTLP